MSNSALLFAVLAMVSWGIWAILADAATRSLPPTVAMVVSYGTGAAVALAYVFLTTDGVDLSIEGAGLAVAAGVFAGVGGVAFYAGLSEGSPGVVTTISALYFVVAAVIGVALGGSMTLRQVAGVGSAVVAVVLLAG